MSTDQVKNIPADTLRQMAHGALAKVGVREDVIHPVADGLVWTSLRGIDSHGIRLLPHYAAQFKAKLQEMAERVRNEPAIDPEIRRVMVPGDPEKTA